MIGTVGKNLHIWDASDGKLLRILKGHPTSVDCLAVSRDGRRLVSAGRFTGTDVRVWDADSGQELLALPGVRSAVSGLAMSRDGRRILACSYGKGRVGPSFSAGTVRLWDTFRKPTP